MYTYTTASQGKITDTRQWFDLYNGVSVKVFKYEEKTPVLSLAQLNILIGCKAEELADVVYKKYYLNGLSNVYYVINDEAEECYYGSDLDYDYDKRITFVDKQITAMLCAYFRVTPHKFSVIMNYFDKNGIVEDNGKVVVTSSEYSPG